MGQSMADVGRRAFVCGHPISHSRSPLIHRFWLAELGLAGSYEAVDVAPERFADFASHLTQNGWVGGNVTIPHKEHAFRLAARRDAAAEAIGAVNTLWLEKGEMIGGNTDAYGFAANLDAGAPAWRIAETAVVLGAGGAARAVIVALRTAGVANIHVVNRTRERAAGLAQLFDSGVGAHAWHELPGLLPHCHLLINTTSLGMSGQPPLVIDVAPLPTAAVVTDIVYSPLETSLLAAARRRGLVAVDGLGMLLHQAVPGFERWFGQRPQVTAGLRAHIVADLETGR